MNDTENNDIWDWKDHEKRIYPEEFVFCWRDKYGNRSNIISGDGIHPELLHFSKVAPGDRDLFLRIIEIKAKQQHAAALHASAVSKRSQEPPKIGAAIVWTAILYIIYDFLMTYYHVGQ